MGSLIIISLRFKRDQLSSCKGESIKRADHIDAINMCVSMALIYGLNGETDVSGESVLLKL